jgi:hypothetical protein
MGFNRFLTQLDMGGAVKFTTEGSALSMREEQLENSVV